MKIKIDRQTDQREREKQDIQTDRPHRKTDTETDTQARPDQTRPDQTDRQTDRDRDRQTDRRQTSLGQYGYGLHKGQALSLAKMVTPISTQA